MAITYGASWVEICNRALDRLGSDTIEDLSEGSDNANHCSRLLGKAIEAVLGDFDWHACRTRVELSPDATAPVYGWDHKYLLPADFVRLIEVENDGEEYSFEGDYILTDADEVYITYIARPDDDPSRLPGTLKNAIEAMLATLLAAPIHKSDQSVMLYQQEMAAYLMKAKNEDTRRTRDNDGPTERGFDYFEDER